MNYWKTAGNSFFIFNRSQFLNTVKQGALIVALLVSLIASAVQVRPANAATTLSVTPITWNVVGLDSVASQMLDGAGPEYFPIGARVCNTGASAAINVRASFVWDSSNSYINLRPGTAGSGSVGAPVGLPSSGTIDLPSTDPDTCTDFYFEVQVARNAASYDTTRSYHIAVTADAGATTGSTTTPRELYVEHLISQSRNTVSDIQLSSTGLAGSFSSVGPGGTMTLMKDQTYWIKLVGSTATNGYEQIETFINFPNTIFQVLSADTTYTAESSATVNPPYDKLYSDGCVWENNPESPNYRSCLSTGKAGGNITVTYKVKVISVPSAPLVNPEPLSSLIYDFSGSSYHYNADYGVSSRFVYVLDPASIPITKSFAPDVITPGGVSTMTIRITNPGTTAISGVNFIDTFPGAITTANTTTSTTACGSPTLVAPWNDVAFNAGAGSIGFSNGTIAGGATCIIKVNVTASILGTHTNTTGHLFINGTTPGTGTDTGNFASDDLTVAATTYACTGGTTMVQWTVPSSPAATNPPDLTGGLPTTQRTNISSATAVVNVPARSDIQTTDGYSGATDSYWRVYGYKLDGQYVQFAINTKNYSQVGLSFAIKDTSGTNGPGSVPIQYSTDGTSFTTHTTLTFPPADTLWHLYPTTGVYDFTGLTNTSGLTYFRIGGAGTGANCDNTGCSLYFDQITFTGCSYFPPPTLSKSFGTDPIIVNSGISLLTFNVGNNQTTPYDSQNLTGVTFTDTLPTGLQIVNNVTYPASTTCNGGAILTAADGTTAISLTGASMNAATTCTVSVYVKGTAAGYYDNVSGYIDSAESDPNKTSTGYGQDNITVIAPPVISKSFGAETIFVGGTTTLSFTITNPNNYAMSSVAFSDTLPAGVDVTTATVSACNGTNNLVLTDNNPAADTIVLSGGSLAASASCTFSVTVTGSTTGTKDNTTGTVSGTVLSTSVTGNTASDRLIVEDYTPALSLKKQVSDSVSGPWRDSMIIAGSADVYYKFTVENIGDRDLTSIGVTDPDINTSGCSWTSPLPVADASDSQITTCIVGPVTAIVGKKTNTARAQGTYNSVVYNSNYDSAVYQNGNFGHLPSAYQNMNLYNDGGAFTLNGTTFLGDSVDTNDSDGINTASYTNKATDDGVTNTPNIVWSVATGGSVDLIITCPSGPCYLNAWFDWNQDNDLNDTGEQIFTNQSVTNGNPTLTFSIPAGTVLDGTFYSRFRLTTQPVTNNLPNSQSMNGATALIGEIEDPYFTISGGVVSPITLSYFASARVGSEVNIEWSTATESGNIGFNLYAAENGKLTRLNASLIPSKKVDSLEQQDYSFQAVTTADTFYIEDVNLQGETDRHGPYALAETYGARVDENRIDWTAIRDENSLAQESRQSTLKPDLSAAPGNSASLTLKVRQTGLYRVTYEMLKNAGLDLKGVPLSKVTLTNQGKAVPIYVKGVGKFGPGAYIEFYGQALDTLYTDTNVYTLQVSQTAVPRIPVNNGLPARVTLPVSYTETLAVNNQKAYANYAPGADAWYDTEMLVFTSPKSWNFPFQVDRLTSGAPATLEVVVWGVTDWPQGNDHHLRVSLNGVPLTDQTFDGLVEQTLTLDLPAGLLVEGTNTLQLTLPGDAGVEAELVTLDKFSVTYQRAFQAKDGRLTFTATGKAFKVTNLPTRNVVVYRLEKNGPVKLGRVQMLKTGNTFSATFAGNNKPATYLVSTMEALSAPTLEAVRQSVDLNRPAQYLVIAHPNFIAGLQPLVQARQAQGLTVSVVDVTDLYTQYSYGIFDPRAIQKYIAYAAQNLGTEYVLLVGGDTYDYRNYLGRNSISFIPSLYAKTGPIANFVPSDPLFADANRDNVPDVAIGRFPVRTTAELEMMVSKTLAYGSKSYGRTSAFASDLSDGSASFKNISLAMSSSLPAGWTVESIHLDDVNVAAARGQLLAAMNRGTALVTFTGHSGPQEWTFSNLFNIRDAAALTNAGKPFVVVQWGCWNNYYVDPVYNYLVQSFLLSGDRGAAAVLGATTLADSSSEQLLGQLLTPRLAQPGMTLGRALQMSKRELAQTRPDLLDVLLGWSLMGDPALVIQP